MRLISATFEFEGNLPDEFHAAWANHTPIEIAGTDYFLSDMEETHIDGSHPSEARVIIRATPRLAR